MVEPQQITIPFAVNAEMTRDNLFTSSSNADVVRLIDDWPQWASPLAIITGPEGSGKSHSLHAWADISGATIWSWSDIDLWNVDTELPQHIGIEFSGVFEGAAHEVKLFHIINTFKASGGTILFTSGKQLPEWQVALPDLKSRLQTAVQVSLKAPDDMLLSAVITKLFSDRQMEISTQNLQYLITHMERSLADARVIVEKIDQEALRCKSKITRNILANTLATGLQNEPTF